MILPPSDGLPLPAPPHDDVELARRRRSRSRRRTAIASVAIPVLAGLAVAVVVVSPQSRPVVYAAGAPLLALFAALLGFYFGSEDSGGERVRSSRSARLPAVDLGAVFEASKLLDTVSGPSARIAGLSALALLGRVSPQAARLCADIIVGALRSQSWSEDGRDAETARRAAVFAISDLIKYGDPGYRADIRGISLQGLNLSDLWLPGADLARASLTGSDLSRANLSGASLKEADLSDCIVLNANLDEAVLDHANLSSAVLVGSSFAGALLTGVNLSYALLRKANLRRTLLAEANLSDADLRDADLTDALLIGANLSGARFDGSSLKGAAVDPMSFPMHGNELARLERVRVIEGDSDMSLWVAKRLDRLPGD
ncbi:pentapeptide repeat protein [Kribbella voronezhensis]|uniref:Pentapeptide repeat protein n=1 Tax=Kribbella voronezhensis TaxID=2512212 RepID=A0A4R7TB01_9ACTN|nr:pentapeptide repeat protein [Kribbella voronezhensis]